MLQVLSPRRGPVPVGLVLSLLAAAGTAWAQEGVIDHSQGFAAQTDLTLNGGATVVNGALRITDANGNEARSAYSNLPAPTGPFQTVFTFHILPGSTGSAPANIADGFGFCLQNTGLTALGPGGGQMAYKGVLKSIFIKFDPYNGAAPPYSATGLYLNGADPANTASDVSMLPNINVQNATDNFKVLLSYDGTTLTETVTDLTTMATFTTSYANPMVATNLGAPTGFAGFSGGTGGLNCIAEIMTWALGAGAAPTNLVATAGTDQSSLTWTAPTGATTYFVLRATQTGGPYTQIASGLTATNYVDLQAAGGTKYFYVVMAATAAGNTLYSNESSCTPVIPVVAANPTTGLTVSETGTTTTFTLTPTSAVTGTFTVTVTSANPQQAQVSWNGSVPAGSVNVNFSSAAPQTVTVTGVDDMIANDPQTVSLNLAITASTDGNFPVGSPLQTVLVSVLEADTPGLVFSSPSGPLVDGGAAVTFTVQLNSKPVSSVNPVTAGTAVFDIVDSAPQVSTVSQPQVTFNDSNWNLPVTITVTPLNDNGQNPSVFLSVSTVSIEFIPNATSTDPVYAGLPPSAVTMPFVDNYPKPPLPKVWGGGGCGLVGLEGLALLWVIRRRRRRPD